MGKAVKADSSHRIILTHLRKTATDIAEKLKTPFVITGDDDVTKRLETLARAKAAPQATIVATMHSVGRGIDLTWCNRVLFAELYWRPEVVIQALGRFSRLSGTAPALVDLLIITGTVGEKMAMQLLDKISDINSLVKAGAAEGSLREAFGLGDASEDLGAALMSRQITEEEDEWDGLLD